MGVILFPFHFQIFPGPNSEKAGLSRATFLEPVIPHERHLTRGILLEMNSTFGADLFSHVNHIFPNRYELKTINSELKKTKNKHAKLNKTKRQNEKIIQDYLSEEILFDGEKNETKTDDHELGCMPCKEKESKLYDLKKENKKVMNDNASKQNEIINLNEKLKTLQDEKRQKDEKISKMEQQLKEKVKMVKTKGAQIEKLQGQIDKIQKDLTARKEEIRTLKSRSSYQSLRKQKTYLKNKEITLGKKEAELLKSRNRVRNLRKKISKLEKRLVVKKARQRELKTKITDIQAENEMLVEDTAKFVELKSDSVGHPFKANVEKCVMELCGENDVPTTKVGNVIKVVSKWIFESDVDSVPSASSANNMMDRAHVLSKLQIREGINKCGGWTLHGDGTSRDGKKIVGQQVSLDSGETLSGGFSSVAVEDAVTLLDNVIAMMEELGEIVEEEKKDDTIKEMMKKMTAVMSDRSSVNKSFNMKLADYRDSLLAEDSIDLEFLFCNAHFLLGLSNNCESVLKEFEKEIIDERGHGLGRDNCGKFSRFHGGESASARFIRTACDVLGPRGDQKNGCKQQWDAFCSEHVKIKSKVTSFRMNRFNNFFLGAAGLFFHREHITTFLQDFRGDLNLKLESVLLDAESSEIISIIQALGLIYFSIIGPFWELLHSNVHYLDKYKFIQKMYGKFKEWQHDSSELMQQKTCVFPEFAIDNDLWDELIAAGCSEITKQVLEKIMGGFIKVIEKQLEDFLPTGKYGKEPSQEMRKKMESCKLTNLVSEFEFGDLDFSQYRRRHASMHFHSSVQMLKRNKTISKWLSSKSSSDQEKLLKICKEKSALLRAKHKEAERNVIVKIQERLEETNRRKKEKEAAKLEQTKKLIGAVKTHGGPCITPGDVDIILSTQVTKREKMNSIKNEIRYLKSVLHIVDKRLVFGTKDLASLAEDLKSVLGTATDLDRPDHELETNPQPTQEPSSSKIEKKRKQGVTVTSTPSKRKKIDHKDTFKFTNQGEWVAIAYESDWFIGTVTEVVTFETAVVQFLSCGPNNVYRWPLVEDIDTIERKFVFANGFEVTSSNGRTWLCPEQSYLQELYEDYHQTYFTQILAI